MKDFVFFGLGLILGGYMVKKHAQTQQLNKELERERERNQQRASSNKEEV